MKRLIVGLAMSLYAATSFAHGAGSQGDKLTGEIVDITCYLDHDSMGLGHAKCARACALKGMPVGLLVGNTLYTIVLSGHESPNKKLAAFAGKTVTVTGHKLEKSGLHAIDMERIELAPKEAAAKHAPEGR